ncbi:MAG: DoxX family membrane protein [Gammaproteobacteria bacterium]|nr:DoxX family membrane protein [Gammaproteobacteria bacterium]
MSGMPEVWRWSFLREQPLRFAGIVLHLLLRTLFGLFWLAAGTNKIRKDWLTSDMLERIFRDRLTEMHPDSFAVMYLQKFAIPLYKPVALVMTAGELYVGIALLLGFTTRWAAGVAFFILVNLAIGGYYDASLIPFFLLAFMMMKWDSGRWFGLQRFFQR